MMITIDDYKKVEIRVGLILSAESIEGSEKLLKLSVDFGEESPRQILSGIAKYFPARLASESVAGRPAGVGLVGVKCAFVTNLEPRMMMYMESNGMILAVSTDNSLSLLRVNDEILVGSLVK